MGRSKFKTVHSKKNSGPREVNPKDAKIGKINTWEDVADEEDEFHLGRDKVDLSLDDYPLPKAHTGRDIFDNSDEEVLDLEGLPSSDDNDDDEDEDDGYDDGDVLGDRRQAGASMYSDDEEEEDGSDKDGETYGRWGDRQSSYYGANVIEDEEDRKLEEEEAAEIIRHQYDGFKESDFFFDEEDYEAAMGKKDKKKGSWKDGSAAAATTDSMSMDMLKVALPESPEERKKLLYSVHPEFESLAKELTALMPLLETYKVDISEGDSFSTSIRHAKFIALSAHLGVLSMYFALMAEERPAGETTNLNDHKIMETLKKTRKTWEKVKDMQDEQDEEVWEEVEDDEDEENKVPLQIEAPKPLTNGTRSSKSSMANGLAAVEKLMAKEASKTAASKNKKRKRISDEHEHQPSSSRRKPTKSSKQVEEGLSDLAELLKAPPKRLKSALKKPKDAPTRADDFVEDTHLQADDAEEKAKRKKSLRFYTSQIVQRSDKRGRAGRDAGGDMDIPHREREKERRERLNADAKKRGMASAPGADLDDADMDEDDMRISKELRGETGDDFDNSDAEYYDMVSSKSKQAKALKKMLHDAEKAGSKVIETEEVDPETGKRAIGYTIEKNKGLTPHRKKDVRNPRVKKRKKYEQAKKRLVSTRAVYKPPTSAYGGEQTGIKTKLVKSVKFK